MCRHSAAATSLRSRRLIYRVSQSELDPVQWTRSERHGKARRSVKFLKKYDAGAHLPRGSSPPAPAARREN